MRRLLLAAAALAALSVAVATPAHAEPLLAPPVAIDSLLWRWPDRTVYVEGTVRGWDATAATRAWNRIPASQPTLTPTRKCLSWQPCITLRPANKPDVDWYGQTSIPGAVQYDGEQWPRAEHVVIELNAITDPECRHTVLTHELGHALGIGHATTGTNDLMDPVLGNGDCLPGRLAYPIGIGDIRALRDLYGRSAA